MLLKRPLRPPLPRTLLTPPLPKMLLRIALMIPPFGLSSNPTSNLGQWFFTTHLAPLFPQILCPVTSDTEQGS